MTVYLSVIYLRMIVYLSVVYSYMTVYLSVIYSYITVYLSVINSLMTVYPSVICFCMAFFCSAAGSVIYSYLTFVSPKPNAVNKSTQKSTLPSEVSSKTPV